MASKTAATKVAKKVAAPKPAKVAKPAKEKNVVNVKAEVRLTEFSMTAVIPVQQYGNIQPKITVVAPSFEEAKAYVAPLMAQLWKDYAEVKPAFLGKITETVQVAAPAPTQPVAPVSAPTAPQAQDVPAPAATASSAPQATGPKPEPVLKAEKAINAAQTENMALQVQDQIEKSTKIPEAFKADLITLVLHKRNELKGK